jgi:hypothetical protein
VVRTQIQLTDEQAALLRKRAAEKGVSLAELIRQGVDLFLKEDGTLSETERRQRALLAAGRYSSGETDISTEHDKYLTEAYRK